MQKGYRCKSLNRIINFPRKGIVYNSTSIYTSQKDLAGAQFVLAWVAMVLCSMLLRMGDYEIPILGINTGRLGFLATISPDKIQESLDELFKEHYSLDKRTLVSISTQLNGNLLIYSMA
jgi:NAD+ kinase